MAFDVKAKIEELAAKIKNRLAQKLKIKYSENYK